MKQKIRYAGYDNSAERGLRKRVIDVKRAHELRASGMPWQKVADEVSFDDEPFQLDSVIMAVKRYKAKLRKESA